MGSNSFLASRYLKKQGKLLNKSDDVILVNQCIILGELVIGDLTQWADNCLIIEQHVLDTNAGKQMP
jgi:hypothetical protein